MKNKTRSEKRATIAQKRIIKTKSGGTFSGQVSRLQVNRRYSGQSKLKTK